MGSLWTWRSLTWTPSQTLMTKSEFEQRNQSHTHTSISDAKIIHCKKHHPYIIYAYILPVLSIKKGVSLTTPKYEHDPIVQPQTRTRAISQQHIQHQPPFNTKTCQNYHPKWMMIWKGMLWYYTIGNNIILYKTWYDIGCGISIRYWYEYD